MTTPASAFAERWDEALADQQKRQPTFAPEDYYRSGRASKAHPDKEGPEWWAENGPKFVDHWVKWRDLCGMEIAEVPDVETGELIPAIELECWAEDYIFAQSLVLHSIIDRVFVDDAGDYRIVDLKAGTYMQAWPMQLALNNLTLKYEYGIEAKWGGFWKARDAGVPKWFDLSIYTDDWLWDQVEKAKAIRDQGLFVAQPTNLCNGACGVRQWCLPMGGKPFFKEIHATITHKDVTT